MLRPTVIPRHSLGGDDAAVQPYPTNADCLLVSRTRHEILRPRVELYVWKDDSNLKCVVDVDRLKPRREAVLGKPDIYCQELCSVQPL
jgi:hypothetical protein